MFPLFRAILAGATLRDRLVASAGGVAGIGITAAASFLLLKTAAPLPMIVAPMGASAVLIFAVPASPLAQPWPVIGGNIISALVGITVARLVPDVALAAGVAVGAAILVMSLLRCLHPPGGAAALTAVIGGAEIASAGYMFALVPVGINAILLAMAGLLFHRFSGHSYPHRADALPKQADRVPEPHPEDLDRALADLGETFDISREDLALLVARVSHHAKVRAGRRGRVGAK
ncbi:HPP family protein [Sphingomonas mucosissima]|uniref:HPP family protein n=1 Tax=Sphingomonas mucosissima TaxID=370959 RepID=A0A245ZPV3_9SPHN|nr:HPP family protein [Sphingomonas mucosissima]OWK31776.1 HPP family protein [Sphingomonas mucosissima]